MAHGSSIGQNMFRRGEGIDVDQMLTIYDTVCVCVCARVGGHTCGTGIEVRKSSLLTRNFMEEILRKVGL